MSYFTKILYLIIVLSLFITITSCGNTVSEITNIPQTDAPHIHSFTDEVIPATCIAEGKIIPKCACGESGDELVIPKISHMAKEVSCEADTLCGVCDTVISPITGHQMLVGEIIAKATCSSDGKVIGICSICGKEKELILEQKEHSFNAGTKWSVSNGVYSASSGCIYCGKNSVSESDTPAFSLDFESPLSNTKYDGFRIVKADSYDANRVAANGSLGLKVISSSTSIFYVDIDAEKLIEMCKVSISFDMTLQNDGMSGKEPSLFSLLGNFQNGASTGSTKYGWMFKFKNDEGKLETVQGKPLNDTNSIALEKGVKYHINILLDMDTGKAEVFVNGKQVGTAQNTYAYIKKDPQNQKLSFRFGDGSMPETIYDNIKISAVR